MASTLAATLAVAWLSPLEAASPRVRSQGAVAKPAARVDRTLEGPVQIMVTLGDQSLRVFNKGVPILASRVSTGQPGYATPPGIYTIIQKNRYHESNIYSGAPMPFMQRITWSGIAMHEGVVPGHPASHGCIRLPGDFANYLFGVTRIGARVIVSREALTPVPIEHPKLFRPEPKAAELVAGAGPAGNSTASLVSTAASFVVAPAQADTSVRPEGGPSSGIVTGSIASADQPAPAAEAQRPPRAKAGQTGPVSVFVSRKERRIYVRQNFEQIYEAPITIRDPELPLGTHMFTAMGWDQSGTNLEWNVISFPVETQIPTAPRVSRARAENRQPPEVAAWTWVSPPGSSLERIEFGEDIPDMVSEVMAPGFTLIISDYGLGRETGKGTDFVIQPR